MSNKSVFSCSCAIVLLGLLFFFAPVTRAQMPAQSSSGVAAPSAEGPLTVTDVIIDKTDKNAVMARDQAIVDAQRLALQKLLERSMTPDRFKSVQLPDDKMIGALVQDFEIKNEQISANRYVANFTVRFSQEAENFIRSSGGTVNSNFIPSAQPASVSAVTPAVVAAPSQPISALVLPYFKNNLGKDLLWEDPNPWRDAWQKFENTVAHPGLTVSVPSGDIADISFGSSDAVWAGDYSVIEKLRDNYKTGVVVLPVAYKSDTYIQVDVYTYKDGQMSRKKSLPPYNIGSMAGLDDVAVFQKVIPQVISEIRALKSAPPPVEAGLEEIETNLKVPPSGPQILDPASIPQKITFDATMSFGNFAQWIEVQKRLASISPSVKLDISSLSKNSALFTVTAELPGGMEGFKSALAEKGLEMTAAVPDAGAPSQAFYAIKMN